MDIQNDTVKIANPYGFYEEISIREFLERTSFEAFSDMPFYFKAAFAFGIFEKNTIFTIERGRADFFRLPHPVIKNINN